MAINLGEMKQKIEAYAGELKTKYNEAMDERYVFKTLGKVNKGLDTITEIEGLVSQVSCQMNDTEKIIPGIRAIVKTEYGNPDPSGQKSLEVLTDVYYSKKHPVTKFLMKIVGRHEVTISDGLNILRDTVAIIPDYVEKLNAQLDNCKTDMRGLKKELRGAIESIIIEKPQVITKRKQLDEDIANLKTQYEGLEQIRTENSSKGVQTEENVLGELNRLELLLNEANDCRRDYITKELNADKNVELINAQIKKVDQYLDLLADTGQMTCHANNYVNVQVPYILKEIKAQKSGIQAITGINTTLNFMDNLQGLSTELNYRIKVCTQNLHVKLEQVIAQSIEAHSIYPVGLLETKKEQKFLGSGQIIEGEIVEVKTPEYAIKKQ